MNVALIVLDGWGLAPEGPGNAVALARTPVFDELWATYPHTQLEASGEAVGLPAGQMGNSEVGHLNLGAGAVAMQDLLRIDRSLDRLRENPVVREALSAPRVHLIGLVSDGGVHSSDRHLRALIELGVTPAAKPLGAPDLVVHAFTDGRDTPPTSGAGHVAAVEALGARVGSVVGRYYAMDRDKRWDRTQRAYDLLVEGRAPHRADTGEAAVRAAYERGETDEFIEPTLVGDDARIQPDDSVLAFNFRPDRMRQISRALAETGPVRRYTTLTEYNEDWTYPVVFPPSRPEVTLPQVIAARGLGQLHVAETEKYAHVTYFFGGGEEDLEPGEVRELVPSPRDVPTYDHKPEMSVAGVASAFARHWEADRPAFGIVNFANPDMVGHTGSIPAAIAAVEAADAALGEVARAVHATGGACIVTADHGNADNMLEPDGSPNTAHSTNPVPLIVTAEGVRLRGEGILADVAPTALALLGIEQPEAMTGRSLIAD